MLNLSLIEEATAFLKGKIRRTPVEHSPVLSALLKVPVYLKLEFLQITGSFKVRGALFYLSKLKEEERKNGVACCTTGNHGAAVAYAAKKLGLPCTVFVPANVEQIKYENILKHGAKVEKGKSVGRDDTIAWAKEEAKKRNLPLVPGFEDEKIMAANGGTIALEILEEIPNALNFLVPVGGGGIGAGIAYFAKEKNPKAKFIACQHEKSPGLKLSLEKGSAVPSLPAVDTLAGGIEGGMGEKCFQVLKDRTDEVILLSEEEIIKGVPWMLENHQYLIEPTSAVVMESCKKIKALQGATILVLTGRNVSYSTLQRIIKK